MQPRQQILQDFIDVLTIGIANCKENRKLAVSAAGEIKEFEALKALLEKKRNGEFVDFSQPVIIDEKESLFRSKIPGKKNYKTSCLEISINFGVEFMDYLLAEGARPNDDIIHEIVRRKTDDDLEEVQIRFALLNEHHANFNAKNGSFHSPLYVAEYNRKKGIAELLKSYGAHKKGYEKVTLPCDKLDRDICEGGHAFAHNFSRRRFK